VLVDFLPTASLLPLKLLYCFAALGALYVFRRRSRIKLTEPQLLEYWNHLMSHPHGALAVYLTENLVTLCGLYLLLRFFSLS
jgi:hypothetical protein